MTIFSAFNFEVSIAEAVRLFKKTVRKNYRKYCEENEYLEIAIQKMIFSEVHRLFVYRKNPQNIIEVLSLSDAARLRSGDCHAYVSSRIKIKE
jgi:Mg2+/Co2+ transporter CorB